MAKVNVYVDDNLKERMEPHDGKLNWSRIAQEAFLVAIAGEEWKMQTDEIEAAIERLKASATVDAIRDEKIGRDHGRKWAMNNASLRDLQTMMDMFSAKSGPSDWREFTDVDYSSNPGGVHREFEIWHPSSAYAQGFFDGAKEFFIEIQNRVQAEGYVRNVGHRKIV